MTAVARTVGPRADIPQVLLDYTLRLPPTVAPAQAGAQWLTTPLIQRRWIPAFAGMTGMSEIWGLEERRSLGDAIIK
ncbi:hypothetical protein GP5015_146 [gamma proteobacterium HTCC5015]|nr:hypothetical protein GP5015_146 [gamma proteobacterium HTCC5015]